MLKSEEFMKLMFKLENDSKYHSIEDNFKRMLYIVQRYKTRLHRYGNDVLEQCRQYEQKHGKSVSISKYYSDRAFKYFDKYQDRDGPKSIFTKNEFKDMINSTEKALRYGTINWNDWNTMEVMLRLYVNRALIQFDRNRIQSVKSDLRHASSILRYFNQPLLIREFFAMKDPNLLVTIIRLKSELITKIDPSSVERVDSIVESGGPLLNGDTKIIPGKVTEKDIECSLEVLHKLDSMLDSFESVVQKFNEILGPKENFRFSTKLSLCETENGGRCYRSTDYIESGETIMLERAQESTIFRKHQMTHCNYCLQSIETFWPCSQCSETVFCSARCSMYGYEQFHRYECGIFGLILGQDIYSMAHCYRHLMTFGIDVVIQCDNEELASSCGTGERFDVNTFMQSESLRTKPYRNMSNDDRRLICRASASLLAHRGKHESYRERTHTLLSIALAHFLIYKGHIRGDIVMNDVAYSRMLEHICLSMQRTCTNGFCWSETVTNKKDDNDSDYLRIASVMCFVASFFNHSCKPNVTWSINSGGIIQLITTESVEPGKELTICYGPRAKLAERQERLINDYCFPCRCELCLRDVANSDHAFKCTKDDCPGPLFVENELEACLQCGKVDKGKQQQASRKLALNVQRMSSKFNRSIRKFYHKESLFQYALRNIFGNLIKPKKQDFTEINQFDQTLKLLLSSVFKSEKRLTKLNRTLLTPSRLDKLEKYFDLYSSMVYDRSYYLLEKCALLLHVYKEMDLNERGLLLVSHINRCMDHIYPSLTDQSLVKLIYMLDYVAQYYHQWSEQLDDKLPKLVDMGFDSNGLDSIVNEFWMMCANLNGKLVDILKYDMYKAGNFMPKLYLRFQSNDTYVDNEYVDIEFEDEDDDVMMGDEDPDEANEQHFIRIYQESKKRLNFIQLQMDKSLFCEA